MHNIFIFPICHPFKLVLLLTSFLILNFTIPQSFAVEYDELVAKASKIDVQFDPDEIVDLLSPHQDDPQNVNTDFFLLLGTAYSTIDRQPDAVKMFRRGLNINSENIELHHRIGAIYYQRGKLEKAKLHIDKCIELDPRHKGCLRWKKIINK
ncbi:tetratricopeptide repeat protein [Pseudomonadota bacterium]